MRAAANVSSPIFGTFIAQQQRKLTSAVESMQKGPGPQEPPSSNSRVINHTVSPSQSTIRKQTSVPLDSIIPATAKPPTQYLSRTYTPLTSRNFRFTIPLPTNAASRFNLYRGDDENHTPLTDRYGFMYDVSQYDVLLLIRATECGNSAPACLTGVKISDREENNSWPEDDDDSVDTEGDEADRRPWTIEIVKGPCDCDGETSRRSLSSTRITSPDGSSSLSGATSQKSMRGVSPASSKSHTRSSVIPRSTSATSILSVNFDSPRHACANTVRKLLDQLMEIHDHRQAAQRKGWDTFVKQRSRVKTTKSYIASSVASGGAGAAAILGLGTADEEEELSHSEGLIGFAQLGLSSNRDERRDFDRLVRNGIPLAYRSKVWLECSGGLEMREPGLFRDLLAQVDGQGSMAVEIEKDVGRTMPLNVFFGGDGAGVDKLRRVLTAYSRYAEVISLFLRLNLTPILAVTLPLDTVKA
jgi:small G protein signaling modulator 3